MKIYTHFDKILTEGIEQCPKNKRLVALHVSSGHMSIFCEYYDTIQEIEKEKGHELVEPQCYSNIKAIYDMHEKQLLFYDSIGFVSSAHDEWEKQKDLPKPEPIYVPPSPATNNPRIKDDHICQYDYGKDVCYFCGEIKPQNN